MNTEQLLREARKIADDIDANVLAVANRQMKPGAFPLEVVCKAASLLRALSQPAAYAPNDTLAPKPPESCTRLAQPAEGGEVVAWRTFDGEGGYDYRDFEGNENYAAEWERLNPRHKGWVEPLYTAPPASQERVKKADPVQTVPSFAQLKQILDNLDRCHTRDSKSEFLRTWIRDWTQHKTEHAQQSAPAVQAVPREWVSDQYGGEFDDMTAGQGYRKGWNDCRAAMLSASPAASQEGGE